MLTGVIIDYSHTWHIQIGDDVTLASRVQILAHDASTKRYLDMTRLGKVKIGDRVFVGAGSIILPGVTIGDDVIIGAGSVVPKDVPSGHLVAGNLAKVICTTDAYISRKRAEMESVLQFGEEYTLRGDVSSIRSQQMKRKLRVVQLLDRLGSGGIVQVVVDIASGLDQRYFEPIVCTMRTMVDA